MGLILNGSDTIPEMHIKTPRGTKNVVLLDCGHGFYEIGMKDFLKAAYYVLANTSLSGDDPRLEFVESIKKMEVKEFDDPEGKCKRFSSQKPFGFPFF